MTAAFDALCARGSGKLEFSWVLEGSDVVWVTSPLMAGTQADGRVRAPGLRYEGLGFSERVYIAGAELDQQLDSVVIEEVGGQWAGLATRVFSTIAERVCSLAQSLDTTDPGTMFVPAGCGPLFAVDSRYYLGTETVKVTAVDSVSDPNEVTVDRAEWDSAVQEHPVASGRDDAQVTDVYDAPTGWIKRRCTLRVHTEDELAVADEGTVIWRGMLSREPVLSEEDSLSWNFSVESRLAALDAPIAGGFDKGFRLRGIYYPGTSCFALTFRRRTGARLSDDVDDEVSFKFPGHWPTQQAWATEVEDTLNNDATVISWGVTFTVRVTPIGTWDLLYTTPSASPRYIEVFGGSHVDGFFANDVAEDTAAFAEVGVTTGHPGYPGPLAVETTYAAIRRPTGTAIGEVVPEEERRRVPRSNHYQSPGSTGTAAEIALYPPTRLYLTRIGALVAGDDLLIAPPTFAAGTSASGRRTLSPGDEDTPTQILQVASVSAATNSVICSEGGDASQPPRLAVSGAFHPVITGAARYADGDGNVADFVADLIVRAPVLANRGRGPFLLNDDVASTWATSVTEANAGRAWLDHRQYTFGKPIKAIEVVREDLKLAGLIPYFDADAKLAVRPFTLGGADIEIEVGQDDIYVEENLGSVTGEADGLVTVVTFDRFYDPAEDEHQEGAEISYRGLSAIARVKDELVLAISPKSRAVGLEPEWEDLSERGRSLIALFGDRRTQVVKIPVGLTCFGALVGSTVSLTVTALPSDGARTEWTPGAGMIARTGILIGRQWDVSAGEGTLEILLHELELAGYAPSCRVTSASGATTSWQLTVSQNYYAPSGTDDTSYFAVGQSFRIIEWDADTPTIREGTIGAITATTLDVTIASWAGMGGATYYTLIPDTSDDADTTAAQLGFAYQGGASGRIPLTGGASRTPRVFAP